jgi:hypothetical protein
LVFRAACNAALPAESRPIKQRVIERIARSSEVHKILESMWQDLQAAGGPITESRVVAELTRNPLWNTLVSEYVEQEKSWKDLRNRDYRSGLLEWVWSLCEKMVDPEAHPVARSVTMVLCVTGILGGLAQGKFVREAIIQPIRIALIGNDPLKVTFSPDLQGGDVHVTFKADQKEPGIPIYFKPQPAGQSTLPIELKIAADAKPIDLKVNGTGDVATALKGLNRQIARNADVLTHTGHSRDGAWLADSVAADTALLKSMAQVQQQSVQTISGVADDLHKLTGTLGILPTALNTPQPRRLTLAENSIEVVNLPGHISDTGETTFGIVTICVGRISTVAQDYKALIGVADGVKSTCQMKDHSPGDPPERLGSVPWHLTLTGVAHRSWGHKYVSVALNPICTVPPLRTDGTLESSPAIAPAAVTSVAVADR